MHRGKHHLSIALTDSHLARELRALMTAEHGSNSAKRAPSARKRLHFPFERLRPVCPADGRALPWHDAHQVRISGLEPVLLDQGSRGGARLPAAAPHGREDAAGQAHALHLVSRHALMLLRRRCGLIVISFPFSICLFICCVCV
jgi:hypothetical protein